MKKTKWRKLVVRITVAFFLLVLSVPFLLTACLSTKPVDPLYSGPQKISDGELKLFDYEPMVTEYYKTSKDEVLKNGTQVRYVTYLSEFSEPNKEVHVEIIYYDQPGVNQVPAVLILPILNGDNSLEKFFAKKFAENGFAVFIINGKERSTDLRDYKDFDQTMIKLTIEQRKALDYIYAQSDIDTSNVFLFGMSMGAIKASLLAAVDQRINASVIILGGGNMPELITKSKEAGIQERVAKLMKDKNLSSSEELLHHLKQHISIDPLTYAPYIDARKVLMVMASRDHVVPYHCQRELWRAIGQPECLILPTGHVSSILYIFQMRGLWFYDGLALNFFQKNLVPNQVLVTSDDL